MALRSIWWACWLLTGAVVSGDQGDLCANELSRWQHDWLGFWLMVGGCAGHVAALGSTTFAPSTLAGIWRAISTWKFSTIESPRSAYMLIYRPCRSLTIGFMIRMNCWIWTLLKPNLGWREHVRHHLNLLSRKLVGSLVEGKKLPIMWSAKIFISRSRHFWSWKTIYGSGEHIFSRPLQNRFFHWILWLPELEQGSIDLEL